MNEGNYPSPKTASKSKRDQQQKPLVDVHQPTTDRMLHRGQGNLVQRIRGPVSRGVRAGIQEQACRPNGVSRQVLIETSEAKGKRTMRTGLENVLGKTETNEVSPISSIIPVSV